LNAPGGALAACKNREATTTKPYFRWLVLGAESCNLNVLQTLENLEIIIPPPTTITCPNMGQVIVEREYEIQKA
jgi:hypothetical protein